MILNNVVQKRRQRPSKPPTKFPAWLGIILAVALGAGGYLAVDRFVLDQPDFAPTSSRTISQTPEMGEMTVRFTMCGRDRYTCVVDEDTIWLHGTNLRLQSYDTLSHMTTSAAAKRK